MDHARNHFHTLVRSTAKALFLSGSPTTAGGCRRRLLSKRSKDSCRPKTRRPGSLSINIMPGFRRREKALAIGKHVDLDYHEALPLLIEMKNEDEAVFRKITEILQYDGLAASPVSFSEYDGIFGAETPLLGSLAEKIDKITFTTAVFERYAACPLRFFLDDLMGLKAEADYHPDTTETGILIRSILKEHTAKVCAAGYMFDEAAASIEESVARHFAEKYQDAEDAFQVRLRKQLVAGLNQAEAGRPGLFAAFLAYERNAPDRIRPSAPQVLKSRPPPRFFGEHGRSPGDSACPRSMTRHMSPWRRSGAVRSIPAIAGCSAFWVVICPGSGALRDRYRRPTVKSR